MISKSNPMPIYVQIAKGLREAIIKGKYPMNAKIPTEDEIALQYSVSRMTARHAVTQLVNEGLVYRVHGKGAFVSSVKLERNLNRLFGFFEDMQEMGLRPSSRILVFKQRLPTQREQHLLQIGKQESVYDLQRIRLLDATPMGIQCVTMPVAVLPNLEEQDLIHTSLYAHMSQAGRAAESAEQQMEAVLAPEIARELGIDELLPFFYFERLSFDDQGTPVELLQSHFRGDMYKYSITLHR